MSRRPLVPLELTCGPFTVDDARRAGLARWHLEGESWRRLGPGLYSWAGLAETPDLKLAAARLWAPPGAVFAGRTAAWLHGLDVTPCDPTEMIVPGGGSGWGRDGVVVRRGALEAREVVVRRTVRATTAMRTLWDLGRHQSLTEAVVIADMALHARLVSRAELTASVGSRAGSRGISALRRIAALAVAQAESPMETRLRLLLVLNGLPAPEMQVSIHDEHGEFLGRLDLFYPEHRLGLEYDGETHRTSLVEDNRRQNRLLGAGIRLLRFTGADVLRRPEIVLAQVRHALTRGG